MERLGQTDIPDRLRPLPVWATQLIICLSFLINPSQEAGQLNPKLLDKLEGAGFVESLAPMTAIGAKRTLGRPGSNARFGPKVGHSEETTADHVRHGQGQLRRV
jgi:hypothetical protein